MAIGEETQPHRPSDENAPKLTNWANEPSLQKLKADFEMAKPHQQEHVARVDHWNNLLHAKGEARPKKIKGRSSVQPKLIRRQAEWRYSALTEPFLGTTKMWNVSPVSWEDEAAAKQNELVLNWQFRTKLNRVKFVDDYVRSTVDEGSSILRVGWLRTTVKVKQEVPEYTHFPIQDQQALQQFQQALQMREENSQAYNEQTPPELKAAVDFYDESGQATVAQQTGTQTVDVDKVVENRPTVEVIDPRNFFLDPTCNGDASKALFAVVSFETNKAALLKEGKRYKNLDQVNWDVESPMSTPDHHTKINNGLQFQDPLRKKVVAYEYWGFYDIHDDGVLWPIVCTWVGATIVRLELNPFPDQKLPFIIVPYSPKKRDVFGEPDAELLEDNQAILGAVTRGMIDLLGRSANAQRGMAKGMLDPMNKRRYENGEDYEYNPNMNPQNGVVEHRFPELPQSAMAMVQLQNQEAEALTGVKSFSGGLSGDAYGDMAAGMKGVLDAAAKREMAILRRLAQGIVELGNKLISMNAVFLSEQEVVRVTNSQFVQLSPAQQQNSKKTGDDSDDLFVTVNREDLAGNFDLEVDISTAEVDNAKAQDMAFMIQTIGPNMPGLAQIIMSDIADLKRMPALAHKIRTFQPQPDPMQEQLKQLELQTAQANLQKIQSEIELNQAKAKEAESRGDENNLKFVNNQTGVSHAREMSRLGAQAHADQELEVTKALLRPKKPEETKPNISAAVGYNQLTEAKDHIQNNPIVPPPAPPVIDNMQPSPAVTPQAPALIGT